MKNQMQQSKQETNPTNLTLSAKPQEPRKPPSTLMQHDPLATPVLRFTPTAWAKLLYFRDHGNTEIGGFGISTADDLLLMEDFVTVKQDVTVASISFDDDAVADFFDGQVDAGKKPEQFARVWLHSHPGDSPIPSSVDEETFHRVFGSCQWAVMFIVARGGKSYARLRFNIGPGGQAVIPVEVDFSRPFGSSDHNAWETEYKANIKSSKSDNFFGSQMDDWGLGHSLSGYACPNDWLEELEAMEPAERRLIMDELAARPDLWNDEEVVYVK